MCKSIIQIEMTNLEKKLEQRKTLLKKFEAFKKLRTVCIRLEMYYYRNNNTVMMELMQERLDKVVNEIEKISITLKPLNAIAKAEYQKSDVHNFLMNSKGKNGRDILIENTLTKSDLFNLTSPNLCPQQ